MPTHRSASADARRVALASAVGTTVEWYDFFIYGTAAATVFGPQFFPQVSEVAGTLAAFATFGIGFIARPLGGVVMGHYGDRIGRKGMLVWALLLMGGATMGIGLDWGGFGYEALSGAEVAAIVEMFPRLGMKERFTQAVCRIVETRPETTYDNFARDFGERFVSGYKPISTVDYLLNSPFKE